MHKFYDSVSFELISVRSDDLTFETTLFVPETDLSIDLSGGQAPGRKSVPPIPLTQFLSLHPQQ
jgi:hypothetical protein